MTETVAKIYDLFLYTLSSLPRYLVILIPFNSCMVRFSEMPDQVSRVNQNLSEDAPEVDVMPVYRGNKDIRLD